jgi:hypothetical protein
MQADPKLEARKIDHSEEVEYANEIMERRMKTNERRKRRVRTK